MLNIIKLNLLNSKQNVPKENQIKTSKHFPSSTREWDNSIYAYNKNSINLIPNTMILANKIIKDYFSLYNFKIEKKIRKKRLYRKLRKISSNKIYVSTGELKHTNNKITINLYIYNRQKHNYLSHINKLYVKNLKNKYKFKYNKYTSIENKKINKYKLIHNNKYKYKYITIIPKPQNIKIFTHRSPKFYIFNNKNIIVHMYNIYKSLYNSWLLKDNIFKYKLNCVHKNKSCLLNLYKKNFLYNKYNKHNIMNNKLSNLNVDYIRVNKYRLLNIRLTKPKRITGVKIINYILSNNKTFNKYEYNNIKIFEKYILGKIILKPTMKNKKVIILIKIRKINKYSKFNKFLINKINMINKKSLLLMYFINREKYLILNYKRKYSKKTHYNIYNYIIRYYQIFLKKSWKKLKMYFFYKQLMYLNKSKYNYSLLQYLSKYLFNLYNKNIEYNLINLKRFYLHSDILSESIKLKIKINRRKLLKQLKTIKKKVKTISHKNILYDNFFSKKLDLKINLTKSKKKQITRNIKYKKITGFRLETKGRLTRRYTASRSIHKISYKGNLFNIYSSYKGLSAVLLKGNLKSNLQYTKLKSKSRIGSFGIKGWVSGS